MKKIEIEELCALAHKNGRFLAKYGGRGKTSRRDANEAPAAGNDATALYVTADAYDGTDAHTGTVSELISWERGYKKKSDSRKSQGKKSEVSQDTNPEKVMHSFPGVVRQFAKKFCKTHGKTARYFA